MHEGSILEGARAAHMDVLQHPVRVELHPQAQVEFASAAVPDADLTLRADIDRHNLDALAPGTALGWMADARIWPLCARDSNGAEVSPELFACSDGVLRTRCAMVPVMMTASAHAARNDCLFYALSRR